MTYNIFQPVYWFGQVDTRPLALFRIFWGAILLKIALFFIPLAPLLYSDQGVVTRHILLEDTIKSHSFSLMNAFGNQWLSILFFLTWAVIAFCIIIGYRTPLMVVLNLICIISVHARNPYALHGADVVVRVLSFWMIFLPLADYYSIDILLKRWRRYQQTGLIADLQANAIGHHSFAFPIRMIQIQVALIYLATFLFKTHGTSWFDGTAVFYTLQLKSLTLPTGDWVLQHVPLAILSILTFWTIFFEAVFMPFIFSPILQPYLRIFALTGTALLHIGIAMTMAIHDFWVIMLVSYLTFFEARWIEKLELPLRANVKDVLHIPMPKGKSAYWILLLFSRSDEIRVNKDLTFSADIPVADVWYSIVNYLPLSRLWRWIIRFQSLRRLIWEYLVLKPVFDVKLPRNKERKNFRLIQRSILCLSLGSIMAMLWWLNLYQVRISYLSFIPFPPTPILHFVDAIGLWQKWNMFSPTPRLLDGWVIIAGEFADGEVLDLRTGLAPATEIPRNYSDIEMRLTKFDESLFWNTSPTLIRAWGDYYCRQYANRLEAKRLLSIHIYFRFHNSHAIGEPIKEWENETLLNQQCPANSTLG